MTTPLGHRPLSVALVALVGLLLPSHVGATWAHPLQESSGEELRLLSFTRAGHGHARAGGWLVLRAKVSNAGNLVLPGTLLASIEGVPDPTSARSLTFLPGQPTDVSIYVYLPDELQGQSHVNVTVGLVRDAERGDELLTHEGRPQLLNLRLALEQDRDRVAAVLEPPPKEKPYWRWPQAGPHMNYEIVAAGSVSTRKSRATLGMLTGEVPPSSKDWSDIGLAVVSEPAVFADAAAVTALQRFVHDGGRVWVMLDQIDPRHVRSLLSPHQSCDQLDVVEVTDFAVELLNSARLYSDEKIEVSLEKPARFVRVHQAGGRVTHRVNGWPAAIWMRVGYGEVLLTTLESQAWLEPGSEADTLLLQTDFKTRLWTKPLVGEAFDGRREFPLSTAVEYPQEFIGNPVLPRSSVTAVLCAFVAILASLGVGLAWRGAAVAIGWTAPLLSLLVGGTLWVAASWIRRDKQNTVASLELVQVSPDGQSATVREQVAVYLDTQRDMQLVGTGDGDVVVGEAMQSGRQRYIAGDAPGWVLDNPAWPPGTWRYQATSQLDTAALVAQGELDEQGLKLSLPPELDLEDPIVGFVPGNPMVGTRQQDGIAADGALMADGGRWISGALISDEQRRRMQVYGSFFEPNDRRPLAARMLYGWTAAWQATRWSDADLDRQGSALVAVPIHLRRPQVGLPLRIPSGLVQVQQDAGRVGRTSVFNDITGTWAKEVSLGISSYLQFRLPPEVLPFDAQAVQLRLDIKAPQRTVTITSVGGDASVQLVELDGPSIPWSVEITDARVLADALDGQIDLLLEVSERQDSPSAVGAASVVTWQIDSFRASLVGTRLPE